MSFIDEAVETDDVFCHAFLQGIVFYREDTATEVGLTNEVRDSLKSLGNVWTHCVEAGGGEQRLLPGP